MWSTLAPKKASGITLAMEDPAEVACEKSLIKRRWDLNLLPIQKLTCLWHSRWKFACTLHGCVSQNLLQGKSTTASEISHSTPVHPTQEVLTELVIKYRSRVSNTKEGYQIYNRDKVTEVIRMNWRHSFLWIHEIWSVSWAPDVLNLTDSTSLENDFQAKGIPHVDLDHQPIHLDGFKWESIKRPITNSITSA